MIMRRGFGLGQATTPQVPSVPWWCNFPNFFPLFGISASSIDACIPQIQAPPAVGAPPLTLSPTAPGAAAPQATVDQLIKDQNAAWKSQNIQTMYQTPTNFADYFGNLITGGGGGGGGGGQPPATDLCSKIFGTGLAGALGKTLCPVVMVVGGVAVVAVVALIFSARR